MRLHAKGATTLGAGLAALLMTATVAAAASPPGNRIAEVVPHGVVADGDRYAAYVTLDRVVHVVDESDPAGSFQTPVPASCVNVERPAAMAGGGQYVLTCGEGDTFTRRATHLRLDLAARTWHELSTATWPDASTPRIVWRRPDAIGARWLQLWTTDDSARLVDWRSGAVRHVAGDAGEAVDLNAVEPLRAMCAPLRRPLPMRSRDVEPFVPTLFDGESAVAPQMAGKTLTVQSCGEPRRTLLSDGYPDDVQLGAGVISYRAFIDDDANGAIHLYLPRCRVRLQWPIDRVRRVAHTRSALWIDRGTDTDAPDSLHRLPLPAACAAIPAVTVAGGGTARRVAASAWEAPVWSGASAERLPLPGAVPPRMARAGREVTVRTTARATGLTWQVGRGSVRTAHGVGRGGRVWRFTPPRAATGRPLAVTANGVVSGGGDARFEFTLGRR